MVLPLKPALQVTVLNAVAVIVDFENPSTPTEQSRRRGTVGVEKLSTPKLHDSGKKERVKTLIKDTEARANSSPLIKTNVFVSVFLALLIFLGVAFGLKKTILGVAGLLIVSVATILSFFGAIVSIMSFGSNMDRQIILMTVIVLVFVGVVLVGFDQSENCTYGSVIFFVAIGVSVAFSVLLYLRRCCRGEATNIEQNLQIQNVDLEKGL